VNLTLDTADAQPGFQSFIHHENIFKLSTLIDDVLANPEYRQNANKMREAIVRTNGLEKATDLLEQAFDLSPKPLTSSIS
jgi:UDP:flavonoid glycosyltransferase YjiC (YdhE family)